jgi:hypothetical protein
VACCNPAEGNGIADLLTLLLLAGVLALFSSIRQPVTAAG